MAGWGVCSHGQICGHSNTEIGDRNSPFLGRVFSVSRAMYTVGEKRCILLSTDGYFQCSCAERLVSEQKEWAMARVLYLPAKHHISFQDWLDSGPRCVIFGSLPWSQLPPFLPTHTCIYRISFSGQEMEHTTVSTVKR